jgi:hypothetical protein
MGNPEHKVCKRCGEAKCLSDFPPHGKGLRGICRACYRANERVWRVKNRERRSRLNRESRERNPEKVRQQRKEAHARYRARLRAAVFEAYGNACVCCGESTPEFFTIDHINGDGAAHRRSLGSGGYFYVWLKRQGFPQDNFQLLCFNCNCAKGLYGQCPHQQHSTN